MRSYIADQGFIEVEGVQNWVTFTPTSCYREDILELPDKEQIAIHIFNNYILKFYDKTYY